VKDQELNPRPHTPRPAALPVKVEQWVEGLLFLSLGFCSRFGTQVEVQLKITLQALLASGSVLLECGSFLWTSLFPEVRSLKNQLEILSCLCSAVLTDTYLFETGETPTTCFKPAFAGVLTFSKQMSRGR